MISLKNLKPGTDKSGDGMKENTDKAGIFGQSLNAGQFQKSKKTRYLESKDKKQAYIILGASLIALAVYSIFFFYGNTVDYLKAPGKTRILNAEIQEYNDVILPSMEKTKELHKASYDKEFEEIITALETVFPPKVDKLGIVRLFESFSVEVAANFPPFEFTSINVGASQQKDGYMVIPISTSIYSSLSGFDKFLSLVAKSGRIYQGADEDKQILDKMVRLMSISNISVKYRGIDEKTGKDGGVDFSVKLNLYSRIASQA